MVLTDIWILNSPEYKNTRASFDRSALKNWKDYLKIGIAGALMLCFEWWAFELLALFSGLMGVAPLAAEVIVINIVTFIFMLPLGISFAASALTGNYIGSRKI